LPLISKNNLYKFNVYRKPSKTQYPVHSSYSPVVILAREIEKKWAKHDYIYMWKQEKSQFFGKIAKKNRIFESKVQIRFFGQILK